MKVLLDMNVSPELVGVLIDGGYGAVHWAAVGGPEAHDETIMEYAAAHDFVIVTHDLDFGIMLIASRRDKPSVVQVRIADLISDVLASLVLFVLRTSEDELRAGALVTVDAHKIRVRRLISEPLE